MELLKFWADWCGPCDQQDTILEEYDATPVRSIDVDSDPDTANEYGVRSLPSLILLSDGGEIIDRWAGLTQVEEIKEAINET